MSSPHVIFDNSGLGITICDQCFYIYGKFEKIFSAGVSGAKLADFCEKISNRICITFPASEVEESLISYDQILRRLLYKSRLLNRKLELYVLVSSATTLPAEEHSNISKLIEDKLTSLKGEINDEVIVSNILNYGKADVTT